MQLTRRSIATIVTAVIVIWAISLTGLRWRYPHGRSHCCIKLVRLALDAYADRHTGHFPSGQSSPEASLGLLYREGLLDAETLCGKSVPPEITREVLASDLLLSSESCGWHYVERLSRSDDKRLAVLWDKVGLGHNGQRTLRGSREVLMVDGTIKWVVAKEWAAFLSRQDELFKNRGISESNHMASAVEQPQSREKQAAPASSVGTSARLSGSSVQLPVRFHRQQHALSCEAAALKIALDYQGAHVSEESIISKLHFDRTPHTNGVWGDPDAGFVGNIDGTMPLDGYGIHCRPLAETARNWKKAEPIENGSIQDLTRHLVAHRPVVVWGFMSRGQPITWHTPAGKLVRAADGEHARVVCGFRGSPEDPNGFFIMDPTCGLAYWPKKLFLINWDSLNRSGVVVYP
ncbi:MAG TPA: C39 family peptidase [Candidatus Limnocylindrales bacterium]|nr:C39 family peptidase [Candidatus Limnocylindrales bacterium]